MGPGYRVYRNKHGFLEARSIDGLLEVRWIHVDHHARRQGYGSDLYAQAYRDAVASGLVLASDLSLIEESRGFWGKQVREKRACCVRGGPVYRWDGEVLEYQTARFHMLREPVTTIATRR